MHFDNLQPGLSAPLPRFDDDDDDDDEKQDELLVKKNAPVQMLIQKKFLEQRKIFLWGAVTDETAKDITEKLLYLEGVAPGKEIIFYINSPGGSITAGMAIYDTMKLVSRRLRWSSPAWRRPWVPSCSAARRRENGSFTLIRVC
jgi:ATP-dependent Clp protease, protease subunit